VIWGRRGRAGWPALALVLAALAGGARAAEPAPAPVEPPRAGEPAEPTAPRPAPPAARPEALEPRPEPPRPAPPPPRNTAVCLQFEGPWSPSLTSLVESDLRTAFGRRDVPVCGRDVPAAERQAASLLTLRLESAAFDQVFLSFDPRDRQPLERDLNLSPFPADGRVLALIVAADELLQAAREEPTVTAVPVAPSPIVPEAAPTVVRTRASTRHAPRQAIAVAFAIDHYGGGQTHLGPDLAWRLRVTRTLFVTLAGQARRGNPVDATSGTVSSHLLGGRLGLGLGLFLPRLALTADLGVRAGRIWFEGEPAAGTAAVGTTAAAFLAYADAVLAVELRIAGPVALRLAAGVGAPLVAQAAAEGTRDVTAAAGVALGAQAGVLVLF
jgi:hypothetical protein